MFPEECSSGHFLLFLYKIMNITQKVTALVQLSERLKTTDSLPMQSLLLEAQNHNAWFTEDNLLLALAGIQRYLDEAKLGQWLAAYPALHDNNLTCKSLGIVTAGNIPAVGFHDWLCGLLSPHKVYLRPSSEDKVILERLTEWLLQIEPNFAPEIEFVEQLKGMEAYIATGSNNTGRYFQHYFGKKPSIIRQNRNACAILDGKESEADLRALGQDIFQYFGLGCRSISKLYVPKGYDFATFFEAVQSDWEHLSHHSKYSNNYDYYKSIYLVNQFPHLDNGFVLLTENEALASPIGGLYYSYYEDLEQLNYLLAARSQELQLIASRGGQIPNTLAFGQAQQPELWDYADGVDTMAFLIKLGQ